MKMKLFLMALVVSLATTFSASAGEIGMLFNLGDSAQAGDLDNSPAITAGIIDAGSTWNAMSIADGEQPSPLYWADGTPIAPMNATARTYRGNNGLPYQIKGWGLAGSNGGDYLSPDRTGIMSGPGGAGVATFYETMGVGVWLPIGVYDVYVAAVPTSDVEGTLYKIYPGDDLDVYIGVTAYNSASVVLETMDQLTVKTVTNENYLTWQEDDNFVIGRVRITDNTHQITIGTAIAGSQGLFSSVEIVLVPEPATMALMGLGSLVMLRRRK